MSIDVRGTFQSTINEGDERLKRTLPSLLATGLVGGADVSLGVFALLLVLRYTGSEMGSSIAFGIGFLALTLANSELFTENFLVPITALVTRQNTVLSLLRLWSGTLVTNLIGGWLITWLMLAAVPELKPVAITTASHFFARDIGTSFASALLAGAIITLMTWMQHASHSEFAKLAAAFAAAFLLAAGHLNHAIVMSLEVFAGIHAGGPFHYGTWLGMLALACLGNIIGGVGFVTLLRLVQVGARSIQQEQKRAGSATGDDRH